jgi:hypothetical protein
MESVTDPMVGVEGTDGVNLAWYRASASGSEIADVCQQYGTDMTVGRHTYLIPALYSNARHSCVFSEPALSLHLKLAARRVLKGKRQTLTIIAGENQRLVVGIKPDGRVIRAHVGASGKYIYRWRPKRATRTQITVTSAADDGRAGLSRAHFGAG